MESVEEFMRRYIAEHIAEGQRQQASREMFHRRFHTADCIWGSSPGTLESLQSEKVESISNSGSKAAVTTRRQLPLSENHYFIRYHLETRGDSWIISEVDVQCCPCDGKPGNTDCPRCQGTGWMNTNLAIAEIRDKSVKSETRRGKSRDVNPPKSYAPARI